MKAICAAIAVCLLLSVSVGQNSSRTSTVGGFNLEDGTPVKLRIARTVSSADAHVGDTVDFEVLEEVQVGTVLVIPKSGVAWATVTEAQSKRRMARGGKLDINIDSVRLVDGEKVPLRAVKEVKGGGHTGAMTGAIVGTSLVFFPAAPLFLFMHGKDITIPKGTEITAYINGNTPLDASKFQTGGPASQPTAVAAVSGTTTLEASSSPPGADIELDGSFIGNTPSTFGVTSGEHTVRITKNGFRPWERKIRTSTGAIRLTAELEAGASIPVATASAAAPAVRDRPSPVAVNLTTAAPVQTASRPADGTLSASAKNVLPQASSQTTDVSQSPFLPSLGIAIATAESPGAKITEVVPNSVAANAGLQVGDIINFVDSKPIRTPAQLQAELAARARGSKVHIGYMFRSSAVGWVAKEIVITLSP